MLSRGLTGAVAGAALVLAGCGGGTTPAAASPADDTPAVSAPDAGTAVALIGDEQFDLEVTTCADEPRDINVDGGHVGTALDGRLRFHAAADGGDADSRQLLLEVVRVTIGDSTDPFDVVRLTEGDRVNPDRSWEAYSDDDAAEGDAALRVTIDGTRVSIDGRFIAAGADGAPQPARVDGRIVLTCPPSDT